MDYLKERTFELFRYTLPGVFLILVLLLLDERINNPFEIYFFYLNDVPSIVIVLVLVLGYIGGLVIDRLVAKLYKKIIRKKYKPDYVSKSKLALPQKYALIRELSPNNFRHIENWDVFYAMCRNLSFGFLVLIIIGISKLFTSGEIFIWTMVIIVAAMSTLSLITNAKSYRKWGDQDVDSTVDLIEMGYFKDKNN